MFAGVVTAPWIIGLVNYFLGPVVGFYVPVAVMMACISIGYTLGESLGRLACLSFGCCYGKPLSDCSPGVQKLFSKFNVIFTGQTKKVSYASHLEGEKMIPIQIITAILYALSGLVETWLCYWICPAGQLPFRSSSGLARGGRLKLNLKLLEFTYPMVPWSTLLFLLIPFMWPF